MWLMTNLCAVGVLMHDESVLFFYEWKMKNMDTTK